MILKRRELNGLVEKLNDIRISRFLERDEVQKELRSWPDVLFNSFAYTFEHSERRFEDFESLYIEHKKDWYDFNNGHIILNVKKG
ncbi:hypothetical protein [Sphingobacterium cellulitidis]|uniref:Uncharacterized protein n=1 Tax=Sphingobacterium cellulitidis TaxID=1768011 RepID=A0A8H9G3C3_9SPHI|nr:hypothetical protein [Sphingobacterium soli]MBA8985963.1 hypothetical protein [Sphingobacterium soli]GGE28234.1 hypothetical protein GCM10011516_27380 [Sphingobacterium soli]